MASLATFVTSFTKKTKHRRLSPWQSWSISKSVGSIVASRGWVADSVDTDYMRVVKFAPKRDFFKTAYHGVRADKQKSCHRTQFPLRLAWARTIHKSQGLSLEHVVGDIGNAEFSTGLTYVLLSRVTSHDGL